MEAIGYLFKPEQILGDSSEHKGTELGHAAVYLDALAHYSGNMSLPQAYRDGGTAMIHAHRDSSRSSFSEYLPTVSTSMMAHAKQAQEFADIQLHAWTDITQAKPLDLSVQGIRTIVQEYQSHVRGISIAMQRVLLPIKKTGESIETVLFPNMDTAVKTILSGQKLPVREPILTKRYITFDQIQHIAAIQVAVWQIRIWEESVLHSFTRALSEERGFPWERSDGKRLQVPLYMLAGQYPEINYQACESLLHPQSESVIRYIRSHAPMFERRTIAPRRAMKRLQYAMMNG